MDKSHWRRQTGFDLRQRKRGNYPQTKLQRLSKRSESHDHLATRKDECCLRQ